MPPFAVTEDRLPDALVLRVSGEIDISSSERMDEALRRAIESDAPTVMADLSNVEFLDSAGLRSLLDGRQTLGDAHRRFIIVGAKAQIRRVFEITRTAGLFELVDSYDGRTGA